jgi:hypothetical protein
VLAEGKLYTMSLELLLNSDFIKWVFCLFRRVWLCIRCSRRKNW